MQIIPFEYENNEIRIIQDSLGEPWWFAKDVCRVLDIVDSSQAVERLDDDEKLIRTLYVSGQNREMWTINEPGLYSLIVRSNKPEAKQFKRWITHEVLPSIRKTGKYQVGKLSELDLIIRSAHALKAIEGRLSVLEAKSHQNSGKTGYWTITAWCKFSNLGLSLDDAMKKGRAASRLSKEWGAEIGKVPDERFGIVNSYREDVLEEVFSMVGETP